LVSWVEDTKIPRPDPADLPVRTHGAYELLTGSGECLAGVGIPGGFQHGGCVTAALVDRANEGGQDRQALACAGASLPCAVVVS
jgi:hypothetical protein